MTVTEIILSKPYTARHMAASSRLFEICHECASLVDDFLASTSEKSLRKDTQKQVQQSISIIKTALSQHGPKETALSFNGGKDCLVMLILYLASLYMMYKDTPERIEELGLISSVYVEGHHAFPEVEDFVKECNEKYGLDTVKYESPMKDSFAQYLTYRPHIKAILAGIRRADPYGDTLEFIQETDHGWPKFVRVHPVLEWHYVEVWDFLLTLKIPYCSLYDLGYTSLGKQSNTARNPCLETEETDAKGSPVYLPAYRLNDDDKERLGRLQ